MAWHGMQIAEKFLERPELANMSFQNDFLKPFVVVIRQSGAKEIRELIIRQVSRMVLLQVSNVKSGWKSMFMVLPCTSSDSLFVCTFCQWCLFFVGLLDCKISALGRPLAM
jgi:Sec7-like guanine-nucleotide exchange factor